MTAVRLFLPTLLLLSGCVQLSRDLDPEPMKDAPVEKEPKSGDDTAAWTIEWYQKGLASADPDDSRLWMDRAAAGSRDMLTRWPAHSFTTSGGARYILSCSLGALGRFEEAVAATELYLEQFPQHVRRPERMVALGEYLRAIGLRDRSREAFEKCVEEFPHDPWTEDARKGLALLDKGL